MKQLNKPKGFTLVEIIISMGLGMVICAATLQAFLTAKQLLMAQQALARLQENARVASVLLGEYIESSGSLGCNAFGEDLSIHIAPNIDPKLFGLNHRARIIAVNDDIKKKLPLSSQVRNRMKPDSSLLWILNTKKNTTLDSKITDKTDHLIVKGHLKLKQGQIIVLSDCSHVDFLKALKSEFNHNSKMTKIMISTQKHSFNKHYDNSAEVGVLSSKIVYVGNTARVNANGHPIDALYSTDLNGRTLELIEGVEFLQVFYGIKNDNTVKYYPAEKVTQWNRVIKVRVSLLLNSIEDGLLIPKKYQINDQEIIPKDRLMRKWWTFDFTVNGFKNP